MTRDAENDLPIAQLAMEKKLITKKQVEWCLELVKKSEQIGLVSSIEEVLVKQGILSDAQVQELREICLLGENGEVFGAYRLVRLIGQGGMGKVYEAVHEIMGRRVALKVVSEQLDNNPARFYQEIRALAKLNHPNIVIIYDAGKINGKNFYAMELLPGPSLNTLVDAKNHLNEKEALKIISAIARALEHAHAKKIIHRDVKPENIIFDSHGIPKLTDFGLVMQYNMDHMTLTQEGFLVGSFYYTSPEQASGNRDLDGRSDIYSLGATLYYALTGRTLYTGESSLEVIKKHLKGRYVSPKHYCPHLSNRTVRLLKKMLSVNREKRFKSMAEVIRAIERPLLINKVLTVTAILLIGIIIFFIGAIASTVGLLRGIHMF
ncbi:MAG: serine/threonine-protein kinase [Chitinispirillaceae bacterium]|jgi:serine/threonine-protein kinase